MALLLGLARSYLDSCEGYYSDSDWIMAVTEESLALDALHRSSEALAVGRLCQKRYPDSLRCAYSSAQALISLDRIPESIAIYRQITQMAAVTDYDARLQKLAQRQLSLLSSIR